MKFNLKFWLAKKYLQLFNSKALVEVEKQFLKNKIDTFEISNSCMILVVKNMGIRNYMSSSDVLQAFQRLAEKHNITILFARQETDFEEIDEKILQSGWPFSKKTKSPQKPPAGRVLSRTAD